MAKADKLQDAIDLVEEGKRHRPPCKCMDCCASRVLLDEIYRLRGRLEGVDAALEQAGLRNFPIAEAIGILSKEESKLSAQVRRLSPETYDV